MIRRRLHLTCTPRPPVSQRCRCAIERERAATQWLLARWPDDPHVLALKRPRPNHRKRGD